MKNRLLSTMLVLCMVLALLPVTVQAADINYPVTGGSIEDSVFTDYRSQILTTDYASIQVGDYIELGKYYGEPILWRCIAVDENGPLMLSDKILCLKAYDASYNGYSNSYRKSYGSNYWNTSCLRQWLNSNDTSVNWVNGAPNSDNVWEYTAYADEAGFMTNFTSEELKLVKPVTQKTYINSLDAALKDGGSKKFDIGQGNFSSILADIDNKTVDAWYVNSTDSFFLLGPEQAAVVYKTFGADYLMAFPTVQAVEQSGMKNSDFSSNNYWIYWLRLPMNTGMSYENVSAVDANGKMSNSSANGVRYAGVRPAFYYNRIEPISEYIYETTDPGEDTKMDAERLNSVTDPSTAAEAVRDMTSGMTQAQKDSATGADLATLYAETAVAKAASKPFTETDILINAAAVADLEAEAAQAVAAVDTALVNGGVATARYISNTVTLTTSSTSEISIRIDPDILTTGVDKIRVEGPGYALTFNVSELEEDLSDILIFKAEPVNTADSMLASGNLAKPLAISLRGYSPFTSGQVYVADNTATKAVKVTLPGGSTSNPVTVSLPKDNSKDTTYQAVVNTTGTTTSSKYNPATTNIDGKVTASGTYTVETKEVNFTDIANKSAEMQKAIRYLAARGVISGTGGTNYSPDASISRAEIAALIVRALGKLDNSATNSFTDVKTSDWYYTAAGSSQKQGIIAGFEDNTFRGTIPINKEQIVAVAARVLISEMKYKTPSDTGTYLGKYSDTVAAWAQPQVALATRENLVVYRTDGTFSGAKDMTRGDAAIIIYRLFQKIW